MIDCCSIFFPYNELLRRNVLKDRERGLKPPDPLFRFDSSEAEQVSRSGPLGLVSLSVFVSLSIVTR
jgi:hypothetical protein